MKWLRANIDERLFVTLLAVAAGLAVAYVVLFYVTALIDRWVF